MQNIKLRPATLDDLDVLKDFEQGVIQYERPFDSRLKPDPIQYYDIEELMARDDACLVVATIDEKLIAAGYALIEASEPIKKATHHAYLGFMYVLPDFRGKGINGKIIQYLTDWSREHNISEIVLEVYAENESAIKAYQKIGLQPDLLKMSMSISKES